MIIKIDEYSAEVTMERLYNCYKYWRKQSKNTTMALICAKADFLF